MAGTRQLIGSGGPLEAKIGYSRAVRVGDLVAVAGTAAFKDGVPFAPGDAAAQTRHILEVIERALGEAGASMHDVIRYRVFVTDIADAPAVGVELSRVFAAIRPAGTLVGSSALVDPALRVEIEVDAIVGSGAASDEGSGSTDKPSSWRHTTNAPGPSQELQSGSIGHPRSNTRMTSPNSASVSIVQGSGAQR